MIAYGGLYQILPSSYVLASCPITHAAMVPICSINLFVGFTDATDPPESAELDITNGSPPRDLLSEVQIRSITLLASESDPVGSGSDGSDAILRDDADSMTPASVVGSITAVSHADSITRVSNVGDFEDSSILPLFDSVSISESPDEIHARSNCYNAMYMANNYSST